MGSLPPPPSTTTPLVFVQQRRLVEVMDKIAQASYWNWQGASLFASRGGDERRALSFYHKALKVLSTAEDKTADEDDCYLDVMVEDDRLVLLPMPLQLDATVASTARQDDSQDPLEAAASNDDSGSNSLYTHSILFHATPPGIVPLGHHATTTTSVSSMLALCTAVVEFNMALLLQWQALHYNSTQYLACTGGCDKTLVKALRLYDFCLDHLLLCSSNSHHTHVLLIAALNNQAMAHVTLSNVPLIRPTMDALVRAIQVYQHQMQLRQQQQQQQPKHHGLLPDEQLQGLLLNVVIFRTISACPAA